jgi:hypothetical protein
MNLNGSIRGRNWFLEHCIPIDYLQFYVGPDIEYQLLPMGGLGFEDYLSEYFYGCCCPIVGIFE